jgi:hypothetical protein
LSLVPACRLRPEGLQPEGQAGLVSGLFFARRCLMSDKITKEDIEIYLKETDPLYEIKISEK